MAARRFTRLNEGFICLVCKTEVGEASGGVCRDHCTHCLRSLHVDEFPGDRASSCGGILAPVKAQMKQDKIVLVYVCRNCGMERRNRSAPDDQMEAILELMRTGFVKID